MSLHKNDSVIGLRVQDPSGRVGTIKWKGRLEKADKPPNDHPATYIGVEFDKAHRGPSRTDGSWNGVKLFDAPAGSVEFRIPQHFRKECNTEFVAKLRDHFGARIEAFPDAQLVKFAIARKFEFRKVVEMLEGHMKWRLEEKPTTDLYFPPGMGNDYPIGYSDGYDKEGNLLYFERPGNGGKCHPKDFVENYGIPTISKWHICSMEEGRRRMAATNYESERVTCIIDMKSLGDCGTSMVKFGRTIAGIDQNNYPEHLSRLMIINAPGFFTTVWRLVKLVVDERTRDKIQVLGKDYKEVLLQYIDEDQLPSFADGPNDTWLNKGGCIGLEKEPEDGSAAVKATPGVVPSPVNAEEKDLEASQSERDPSYPPTPSEAASP